METSISSIKTWANATKLALQYSDESDADWRRDVFLIFYFY